MHEFKSTAIDWQGVLSLSLLAWFGNILATCHGKNHITVVDFGNIPDLSILLWFLQHACLFCFVIQLLEDHLVQMQAIRSPIHHGLVALGLHFTRLTGVLLVWSWHPALGLGCHSRHVHHVWLLSVSNWWMLLVKSLRGGRCCKFVICEIGVWVGQRLYFAYVVSLDSHSNEVLHAWGLWSSILCVACSERWKVTCLGSIHVSIWHFIVNIY